MVEEVFSAQQFGLGSVLWVEVYGLFVGQSV